MTNPSFTQLTFRGRNDDGSESAATWKATQGTDWTQDTGANFRCRFRIDETAARSWTNKVWNLYYSLNAAAYAAVSGSTPVQFSLSGNFADGDDCTAQLTGGTGAFVTNNNGMKETTGGATNTGAAGELFEVEYCLTIDGAQVADNDTINLRVYDGTSAIAAYTDTPIITVNRTAIPKSVDGAITPAGALTKRIDRSLTGSISPGATLAIQTQRGLTGAISLSGALTAARIFMQSLDGALSFAGALTKTVYDLTAAWIYQNVYDSRTRQFILHKRLIAGLVERTVGQEFTKSVDGAITPAGAFIKQTNRLLTGAFDSAGAVIRQTSRSLTGDVNSSATLIKQVQRALNGAISFVGDLSGVKLVVKALDGALSFAGDLVRRPQKNLSGASVPAGSLVKQNFRAVTGAINPAGALASLKVFVKNIEGAIAPAGALARLPEKILGGTLNPTANLVRKVSRSLAGMISPSGITAGSRTILIALAGAISSVGSLTRQTQKELTGILVSSGGIGKAISRALNGIVNLAGELAIVLSGLFTSGRATGSDAAVHMAAESDVMIQASGGSDAAINAAAGGDSDNG